MFWSASWSFDRFASRRAANCGGLVRMVRTDLPRFVPSRAQIARTTPGIAASPGERALRLALGARGMGRKRRN